MRTVRIAAIRTVQYAIIVPVASMIILIGALLVLTANGPRAGGGCATLFLLCIPIIGWIALAAVSAAKHQEWHAERREARGRQKAALHRYWTKVRPLYTPWG